MKTSEEIRNKFNKDKGYKSFNPTTANEYTYWLESKIIELSKTESKKKSLQ